MNANCADQGNIISNVVISGGDSDLEMFDNNYSLVSLFVLICLRFAGLANRIFTKIRHAW